MLLREMSKHIEFENALGDLITETFETKEELLEAIKYFDEEKIADILKDHLKYYEALE